MVFRRVCRAGGGTGNLLLCSGGGPVAAIAFLVFGQAGANEEELSIGAGWGWIGWEVSASSCTASGAKNRSDWEQRGVCCRGWLAGEQRARCLCSPPALVLAGQLGGSHGAGAALVLCPWPGCLQHCYRGLMPSEVPPQCFPLRFLVSAVLPSCSSLFQQGPGSSFEGRSAACPLEQSTNQPRQQPKTQPNRGS